MPRPHIGTTPCKFSFQANDLNVTLHRVGYEGKLVIAFKRGGSRQETGPMLQCQARPMSHLNVW